MVIRVWQSKLHRSVRYSTFHTLWRIVDPIRVHITMKLKLLLCHVIVLNYILFIYKSNFCKGKIADMKAHQYENYVFSVAVDMIFYNRGNNSNFVLLPSSRTIKNLLRFYWNNCVKQTLFKFKSISTELHFS